MNDNSVKTRVPLLQKVLNKCSTLKVPAQAVMELTYRCNQRCLHCYIDTAENDELTLPEWQNVLSQLKAAGTIFLLFTGGEILVREDLMDIATYARRNGFIPGFITNCTLVTPEISKIIAGLKPFSVATSLHGATAATHEYVTRLPGSFERTLNGIQLLVDAGLSPVVQTLIMKSNVNELAQIKKLVEELGAVPRITMGIAPSKSGADFPFKYEAEGVEYPETYLSCTTGLADDTGPGPCKAGKAMCSISPRGDISPCPMFPLKIGNVRQSDFSSIWSSKPCQELQNIRSVRHSDFNACNTCRIKTYCNRCSGVAYLESGLIEGPSPSACRQAQARFRLNQLRGCEDARPDNQRKIHKTGSYI